MSELTEEEKRNKAMLLAAQLAVMLNQADADGLLVNLDTNEFDFHSVGYAIAGGKMSSWITVRRSGKGGGGPYEVVDG